MCPVITICTCLTLQEIILGCKIVKKTAAFAAVFSCGQVLFFGQAAFKKTVEHPADGA